MDQTGKRDTSSMATGARPPRVVVMGVSGVGKSVVGALLAERLEVPYADGDDLHPEANRNAMRAGRPLTDEQRAPWLHAVGDWLRAHEGSGGVVSCSALRRRYRDLLVGAAPRLLFLHLTGDPELVRRRMTGRDHFMPLSLLGSQLRTLEPLAPDERHLEADIAAEPATIVDEVLHRLGGPADHPPPVT